MSWADKVPYPVRKEQPRRQPRRAPVIGSGAEYFGRRCDLDELDDEEDRPTMPRRAGESVDCPRGPSLSLVRCAGAWRDGEDRCLRPEPCPHGPDRSWALVEIQKRLTFPYRPPEETRPAVIALLARKEDSDE